MKLTSINIGKERVVPKGGGFETTGIYKEPVSSAMSVTTEGLPGDAVCDKKHHAGPDQAVYVYMVDDYDWWSEQLGSPLAPGTFGDNLTISGMGSAAFNIGDRLRIGSLLLEVTAPRIPCGTFARRMGDPEFVKKFRAAERPGMYCRVLSEGRVQAGDPVTYEAAGGSAVSLVDVYRDYYEPELTETAIRRYLDAPVAIRVRAKKEEQLRGLAAA